MKKSILTLVIVFGIIAFCNAQTIEIEKAFGGYKYTQDGKRLNMGKLATIMEANPESVRLIKKAKSNNVISIILGAAGGGLIGYPLGQAIAKRETNWTLAGIGLGVIALGIPFGITANKKSKQAVDLYNSSLESSSFRKTQLELGIVARGNGIGVALTF